MLSCPSTATPIGLLSPVVASAATCWLAGVHRLIALLPVSARYTLPCPSTATPIGLFSPDTSRMTGPLGATHSLILLLPLSAKYTLPAASTATPVGLLNPVPANVVICCIATFHSSMALLLVSEK